MTYTDQQIMIEFAALAEQYCSLLETNPPISGDDLLLRLQLILPSLYLGGVKLPICASPADDVPVEDVTNEEWSSLYERLTEQLGAKGLYWEVFDPSKPEHDEVVAGSLADDLADIYRDLRAGLVRWRLDNPSGKATALWAWRFNWEIHWGAHAVNALRAIHWHLAEHHFEEGIDKRQE